MHSNLLNACSACIGHLPATKLSRHILKRSKRVVPRPSVPSIPQGTINRSLAAKTETEKEMERGDHELGQRAQSGESLSLSLPHSHSGLANRIARQWPHCRGRRRLRRPRPSSLSLPIHPYPVRPSASPRSITLIGVIPNGSFWEQNQKRLREGRPELRYTKCTRAALTTVSLNGL